jgi:2-aminoethylphosphonate-pyruvate transaminase
MNKYLLFTPGPVNVAQNVRAAICKEDICHREVDFDRLLLSIENKLLQLFQIKNVNDYRAVVITGSGTAANESMLSSVVGDKNILILSNGEFGERLHNISSVYNTNTHLLDFAWGESFDLEIIETYIKQHHIDVVAMAHHETSSGMLNPLEQIGALCKAQNALFILDCVSSAGAEVIDMEKHHIAFCSSSSSKAIGSYSGLSFIVGRINEFEKLKDLPVKSVYLNLYNFYCFIKNHSQTPNTPAVHLFFALEQALKNILNEGVSNRFASLKRKAILLRQGMRDLNLNFLLDQSKMSSILTTVYVPAYINVETLRKHLREKSIIIYEGKGCFKAKVFQVGSIGELSNKDIQFFLDTLKDVLLRYQPVQKNPLILSKRLIHNIFPELVTANAIPVLATGNILSDSVAVSIIPELVTI